MPAQPTVRARSLVALILLAAIPRAEAGPEAPRAAPIHTLEDLFARFLPGEPWPAACGIEPGGELFCHPEDALSTPGGGLTLSGVVDDFEVSAFSNPQDATVKSTYARRPLGVPEAAAPAARASCDATLRVMTPVSAEAFRRVEAILTALARRRGCRTEATREPAQTEGAVARLGARRLRCEGAAVELEAFVDLGECTVVAGEARHTPGQVGLRVHQRR